MSLTNTCTYFKHIKSGSKNQQLCTNAKNVTKRCGYSQDDYTDCPIMEAYNDASSED